MFAENMEKQKIIQFTDLKAWQKSHLLVLSIYQNVKIFPKEELFSLTDQMKRAAISITSNIAEGFGRRSYKEKARFYYLAQGSLTELKNQIITAKDIGYLDAENYKKLFDQANIAHQLLQGLTVSTRKIIEKGEA
jgi:four helix bundle protein